LKPLLVLLVTVTALPVFAADLKLEGDFIQGGLVIGQAKPGASITLDGSKVEQSADGYFLIGFSRDAKPDVNLTIRLPDGGEERRKLKIKKRTYDIQRIDGLPKRKVTPSPKDLKRIKKERAAIIKARRSHSATPYFRTGFIRPAKGRISGVYGSQRILNGQPRRPHFGLDIAAPTGAPVEAAAAGRVIFTHPGMFFNGKTVIIDHGLGLASTYIHLSDIAVRTGDVVVKGQIVGKIGQTGRATGPHLHWSLRLNNTELDPELLF